MAKQIDVKKLEDYHLGASRALVLDALKKEVIIDGIRISNRGCH